MTMVKIAAEVRTLSTRQPMIARRQPPPGEADQERAAGAHAGRLGRGEQAAVHAADAEDEQQQRRPDVPQRDDALAPGWRSPRGMICGRRTPMIWIVMMYSMLPSRPGRMPATNSLEMSCSVSTP